MTPFQELPHTGDLAYRVTGDSTEEVFEDASRALFSTITDLATVVPREERVIRVAGNSPGELLIEFLRLCLDLFALEEFIASSARVHLEPSSLTATLSGEIFDPSRHPFKTEIKAVTYHEATVKKIKNGWEATFVLDL